MGLFFKGDTIGKISKSDRDKNVASQFGCSVCSRNGTSIKHPNMKPSGVDKPVIYILGESPGYNEDIDGKQFVGDAGDVLKRSLDYIFQDFDYKNVIRYNNVVRCFHKNEAPTKHEIDCCYPSVVEDILATKPAVIFGFGNTPLSAVLDAKRIMMWRGRKIPIKLGDFTTWYFPMLHPSFVMRKRKSSFKNEFDDVFERDLANGISFAFDTYEHPIVIDSGYEENIEIALKHEQRILDKLEEFKKYEYLAIDIETQNLRPNSYGGRIATISIGTDEDVFAFPLFLSIDDALTDWSYKIVKKFKELLLSGPQFIAHNLKFELEWFYHLFGTQDILRNVTWHDTMAQAYVLDERTSQNEGMLNLDRLAQLYFGFNLKDKSNINKNEITKNDLEKLLIYNAMDSKYTYKIFQVQKKMLDSSLEKCYNSLIETAKTLSITQNRGLTLDLKVINDFGKKFGDRLKELKLLFAADDDVKKFVAKNGDFNPLSSDHLEILFKDIKKFPKLKATEKTKDLELSKQKFAMDDDVLTRYSEEMGSTIAKEIIEYRHTNKLLTMYVINLTEEVMYNDKLYPNFNLYFTSTGRLSSGRDSN